MKFVLHSHDNYDIEQPIQSDMHAPLAPDNMIYDFQSGAFKFVCSLHDTRMKFRNRKRILFGKETRKELLTVPFICAEIIALMNWVLMLKLVLSTLNTR